LIRAPGTNEIRDLHLFDRQRYSQTLIIWLSAPCRLGIVGAGVHRGVLSGKAPLPEVELYRIVNESQTTNEAQIVLHNLESSAQTYRARLTHGNPRRDPRGMPEHEENKRPRLRRPAQLPQSSVVAQAFRSSSAYVPARFDVDHIFADVVHSPFSKHRRDRRSYAGCCSNRRSVSGSTSAAPSQTSQRRRPLP